MTVTAPAPPDERVADLVLPPNRLIAVTVGVLAANFLAALEGTVVSTAVPTIVSDLGGLAWYSWVFTAYMLAMTVTVPLWGKLSDVFGRRDVYLASIALFVLGSACAGQATSMPSLIFWRVVQGLGGGALTPVGQAILGEIYSLEGRARVQTWLTTVLGLASACGPMVGGAIAQHLSWRWVFYLNLPFAIAGGVLLLVGLPRCVRGGTRPTLDLAGAALFSAAFALLLIALQFAQTWGYGSGLFLGALGMFGVLLAAFVRVERSAPDPMVPLTLFREPMVVGTVAVSLFLGMGLYGGLTYLPLFFQGVLGRTASQAGGDLTPLLVAWMAVAMFAPRLVLRLGYRVPIGIGAICFVAGYLLLVQGSTVSLAIGAAALLGTAGGLCFSPTMLGAQSVVERGELGVASSAVTFCRNIGGAVGVAIMGAAVASSLGGHSQGEALTNPALVSLLDRGLERAFHVGLLTGIACLACLALIPRGVARDIRDEAHRRHLQAAAGLHSQ